MPRLGDISRRRQDRIGHASTVTPWCWLFHRERAWRSRATRIRDYLGWEEVQSQLKGQEIDLIRQETLNANLDAAKKKVPEAVQQAYNIVVTVSDSNEVQAFKLALDATKPLFEQIKSDSRCRIRETAVSFEALLPDGPYDLWRSGETSRRVKDLVGAFAQFPHLPKMLNRKAILDTLIEGCREGQFVLRLTRPDRSARTIWRQQPDDGDLKNTTLEVVLPDSAELSHLEPSLLAPAILPDLWTGTDIAVADPRAYFSGGKVIKIARQGYDEPVTIPKRRKRSWTRRSPWRSRKANSGSRTARRACCPRRFPPVSSATTDGCRPRPRPSPRLTFWPQFSRMHGPARPRRPWRSPTPCL